MDMALCMVADMEAATDMSKSMVLKSATDMAKAKNTVVTIMVRDTVLCTARVMDRDTAGNIIRLSAGREFSKLSADMRTESGRRP